LNQDSKGKKWEKKEEKKKGSNISVWNKLGQNLLPLFKFLSQKDLCSGKVSELMKN